MAFGLLLPLLLATPQGAYDPDPEATAARWVVVYNLNWPDADGNGINDSLEVAQHWLQKRRVPQDRLVGLAIDPWVNDKFSGAGAWQDFWDQVVLPLRSKAVSADHDQVLGFLFCYGVPNQIALSGITKRGLDTTIARLWDLGTRDEPGYTFLKHEDPYFDPAPGVAPAPGRFDPHRHRKDDLRTYLVGRLDGVDKEHAIELVDMALYGDVYLGLGPGEYQGRAYVDTQYGPYSKATLDAGYPYDHWTYADADKALAYGRGWLQQTGLPVHWEPNLTEIGEPGALWEDGTSAATAPRALIYEGWKNHDIYHDAWDWMVGSFGADLDSNSIARLRNAAPGTFLGEALRLGLTAGVGVVDEPYTEGHPFPEVFAYYMLKGYPFAEAARISDPRLLWTSLYVGDPLYQPFRPGKLTQLDTTPPPPLTVDSASWTGVAGEWSIDAHLDTTGLMPDLVQARLHWGEAPDAISQTVAPVDDRERLFHHFDLTALPADQVIYYRLDGTDPSGNRTLGPLKVLHTGLETQAVIASVSTPNLTVAAGSTVPLEVAMGAAAGFDTIAPVSVRLTAAHLGLSQWDIWPRFFGPDGETYASADDTVRVGRLALRNLTAGSYTVEVTVNATAGTATDTLVLTVQ